MTSDTNATLPSWALRELQLRAEFQLARQQEPARFFPFLPPTKNRVLIVTDGLLHFDEHDAGLNVFVRSLLDTPGGYVQHEITLAHMDEDAVPTELMPDESRIANRIPGFKFDVSTHFTPDMYDVVMLLGYEERFGNTRGTGPEGQTYPAEHLSQRELVALTQYMNGGGGLIATGDHGNLGKALSHAVPRARNMRRWESAPPQRELDEVSMDGPHRNDTNRGELFEHQSDDLPQVIEPKMYTTGWAVGEVYPHPLLCGPRGVIRVMPDHPHEGQCIEPDDTNLRLDHLWGGAEYPAATDGGTRPVPEIISTNRVPPGNVSTTSEGPRKGIRKCPTIAHTFGGIAAYDGHRAGVGRVVTDSTFHHFLNVNLAGIAGDATEFPRGFFTPLGIPILEEIRAYYRNLMVWTTRPELIRSMNLRMAWGALFDQQVMEAVLATTQVRVSDLRPQVLRLIGAHARDALGRAASQCQILDLVLNLVLYRAIPDVMPHIDPWRPDHDAGQRELVWFNGSALLDIALGGALVGIREAFGTPTPEETRNLNIDRVAEAMARGGTEAVQLALRAMTSELNAVAELINRDSKA
jgi:hypothetical protein